ncbi:MAG: ABC transporter permease subunit [Verrucomicrobia bacterium]|nr:ABC transporter permease subunit [Verrucomicrobiota bacterium]
MTFLPIVERELRVAARRTTTYRTRFWMVVAAVVVCVWQLLNLASGAAPARVGSEGPQLFNTLSVLAFAYCLLVGAQITADCLSQEKRDGTLGLLFLTDLKGYDVVFGKLAASSINSVYGLLAILPLLALPVLLGGVSGADFTRMALVLMNTLFFSMACGMLISTLSRHERKAMMGTILLLFVTLFGPWMLLFFLDEVMRLPVTPRNMLPAVGWSPLYCFAHALGWLPQPTLAGPNGFVMPPSMLARLGIKAARQLDLTFFQSLAMVHFLSWAFLLRASAVLPKTWEDKPRTGWLDRWNERWQQFALGDDATRKAWRRRLLEINPFLWLAGRDRMKSHYAWFFLGSLALIWFWGYWRHGSVMLERYMLVGTVFLWHIFFKIWVASEACNRLVEERRAGALELLLSTRLTVVDILAGQRLALQRQFAKPIVGLMIFDLILLTADQGAAASTQLWLPFANLTRVEIYVLFGAGMIVLVGDFLTLSWVGMWQGLSAATTNRAIGATVTRVMVLPWIIYIATRNFAPGFFPNLTIWVLASLICNVLLIRWARENLLAAFREIATFQAPTLATNAAWLRNLWKEMLMADLVKRPAAAPRSPAVPSQKFP